MSEVGWTLDDAEALATEFPTTFLIAPLETRTGLRPGEYAKLIFRFATATEPEGWAAERMWTIVLSNSDGRYTGRLSNEPASTPDDAQLHYGATIAFEARHIINWEDADAHSLAVAADPEGHA